VAGAIAWLDQAANRRLVPVVRRLTRTVCYAEGWKGADGHRHDAALSIISHLSSRRWSEIPRCRAGETSAQRKGRRSTGPPARRAAAAIFAIQNAQTATLYVVVVKPDDPRDFAICAFSGGPVHCFAYGAELGVRKSSCLCVQTAAVFSAVGYLRMSCYLPSCRSGHLRWVPAYNNASSSLKRRSAALNAQNFAGSDLATRLISRYTFTDLRGADPSQKWRSTSGMLLNHRRRG